MQLSGAKQATVDGKPASLLLFSDTASCQALFNFLLTRKFSLASFGAAGHVILITRLYLAFQIKTSAASHCSACCFHECRAQGKHITLIQKSKAFQ